MSAGLFQSLIGEAAWAALHAPVRAMHGNDAFVSATGRSIVQGSHRMGARLVRRLCRLPEPGHEEALRFELRRSGGVEAWTRHFSTRAMPSVIDASPRYPGAIRERLGPATLHFELVPRDGGIDWITRELRVFGLRMPSRWAQGIGARSYASGGQYRFSTWSMAPLVGFLVGYDGWLDAPVNVAY